MYKNTPHALRALVLGTLLTTTGLGFASANTTTTTHAPATTVEATKMETTKAPMAKTDATKMETTKTEAANVKSTNTASPAIVNTCLLYTYKSPRDSIADIGRRIKLENK